MKRHAVIALVLVACGDDGNHMQMVDAPAGSVDAMRDAVSIDAAPAATNGLIEVTQGVGGGSTGSDVDVQFSNVLFGTTVGTDGPCTLYGVTQMPRYSAGTVTITGTTQSVTMTATNTAPNVRYSANGNIPTALYNAGATITVTAAGGPDVPAFTAMVTGPATLTGFTPPTSMSRSGYTATWTAGAGPSMWVIFSAADLSSGDAATGICRVDDTGSFTIPASTWALTPATATTGFIGVGRIAPTTVNAGGTMVIVQAVSYVTSDSVTLTN